MKDSLDSARFLQVMPFYQEVGALLTSALEGRGEAACFLKPSNRIVFISHRFNTAITIVHLSPRSRKETKITRNDEGTWNEDMALLSGQLCLLFLFIFSRCCFFLDFWSSRAVEVCNLRIIPTCLLDFFHKQDLTYSSVTTWDGGFP